MKKIIKEMGIPVLVVLIPAVWAVVEKSACCSWRQWLLYLLWLIIMTVSAVFIFRFKNETLLDKACVFILLSCLVGFFVCLLMKAEGSFRACCFLGGWSLAISGFSDFFHRKKRHRFIWIWPYCVVASYMLYCTCSLFGYEWTWLLVLPLVFSVFFVLAIVYNVIAWLYWRNVCKTLRQIFSPDEKEADE